MKGFGFGLALAVFFASPLALGEEAQRGPTLRLPGMAPIPLPPRGRALEAIPGEDEPSSDSKDGVAPRAAAPNQDPADKAPPPRTKAETLDDLYARLALAKDADETSGLVTAIDRLELDSGSDAGDLLMARAIAAINLKNYEVALALLDKIVDLQPDWAEAWNKRATVRYIIDDFDGSMADIAHVLKLEPRHFGALSGMGMILERGGFREDALRAYRRALAIAPHLETLKSNVDRLTKSVEGQEL
jgi:tetratricopeptide (TPR) repeat protein